MNAHRPLLPALLSGALLAASAQAAPAADAGTNANVACAKRIETADYKGAAALCPKALDAAPAGTAQRVAALRNLAALHRDLGRYEQAEPLLNEALADAEKNASKAPDELIATLSQLALLYQIEGRQTAAEPLLSRALALSEKTAGTDTLPTAQARYRVAMLYYDQHRYADAEPLLTSALAIQEKQRGADDATAKAMRDALSHVEQELAASNAPGLSNTIGPGVGP